MAKLSARGYREIATINGVTSATESAVRLALRSDGVVLLRYRGEATQYGYRSGASGYKIVARFDKQVFAGLVEKYGAEKILRKVAARKGVQVPAGR